ncbi:hypothetical protein [Undibacterium danionis]|uniref:Uncharacterized protein n=1 Tax=Undibacterium danionis TaxID=1812100 RepID=A0ABV6IBH2_9BURK
MTDKLSYQRIRNRILEIIEWIIESEKTPPELGFNNLINHWDDWTYNSKQASDFPAPFFSESEGQLLAALTDAINIFCQITLTGIKNENEALHSPEWKSVIVLARHTHEEMMKRRRFSEDTILDF